MGKFLFTSLLNGKCYDIDSVVLDLIRVYFPIWKCPNATNIISCKLNDSHGDNYLTIIYIYILRQNYSCDQYYMPQSKVTRYKTIAYLK